MLIFDFFAGTGSATKAFEDAGHTVIKFELDKNRNPDVVVDILTLNAKDLIEQYGRPDFIWASPPCTTFSVASAHIYWNKDRTIKDDRVYHGIAMVKKALELIKELEPTKGWILENPRGMLRGCDFMQPYTRRTITYCQYGDFRMKPTDLWGEVPNWIPRPMCKRGMPCHEESKSGKNRGNARLSKKQRSMIPYALGKEILEALEK